MSSFYDPSVSSTKAVAPAKRPATLDGKIVGLYDNTKEQADVILEAVAMVALAAWVVRVPGQRAGVRRSPVARSDRADDGATRASLPHASVVEPADAAARPAARTG